MGNSFSRVWRKLFGLKNVRILILGLDGAGKTTLLYRMKLGKLVTTIPTIGFNVETVKHKNIQFSMWDASGQDKTRKFWNYYFEGTRALIFVVDSNDRDRLPEANEVLSGLLQEPLLKRVPLLLFNNKTDLPNSVSDSELKIMFKLDQIDRDFKIQNIIAITGQGVFEGLDWVVTVLNR